MKTSTLLTSSTVLAVSSLATATINITYSTGAWDHISAHSEVQVKWETTQTLVCFSPAFALNFLIALYFVMSILLT